MIQIENSPKVKTPHPALKQLIMWSLAGLMAGLALGTIVGIAIYNQSISNTSGSFDDVRKASEALGLPIFNAISQATSNFLSQDKLKAQVATIKGLLVEKTPIKSTTSQKTASLQKDTNKTPSEAKITTMSLFGGTPTQIPQPKTNPAQPGKYKDGYGPDDINTTTPEQLDKIPRLSANIIKEIMSFIQTKGPIKSFDQFLDINGVGEKTVEKMRQFFHIK
jgi:DNA uptake protein ComE-like DNA-binding protein